MGFFYSVNVIESIEVRQYVVIVVFTFFVGHQVIAYAMKEYQLTLQEATAHVKKCRNVINPNSGFCKQLHTYEAILSAR